MTSYIILGADGAANPLLAAACTWARLGTGAPA